MDSKSIEGRIVVALLYELKDRNLDLDDIVKNTNGILMGSSIKSGSQLIGGTDQKTEAVSYLRDCLEEVNPSSN